MENFVATIQQGLSADALWGAVGGVSPIIISLVLFAFAFNLVRKAIKGASKGKARM